MMDNFERNDHNRLTVRLAEQHFKMPLADEFAKFPFDSITGSFEEVMSFARGCADVNIFDLEIVRDRKGSFYPHKWAWDAEVAYIVLLCRKDEQEARQAWREFQARQISSLAGRKVYDLFKDGSSMTIENNIRATKAAKATEKAVMQSLMEE